jgi:hypothetical protein
MSASYIQSSPEEDFFNKNVMEKIFILQLVVN